MKKVFTFISRHKNYFIIALLVVVIACGSLVAKLSAQSKNKVATNSNPIDKTVEPVEADQEVAAAETTSASTATEPKSSIQAPASATSGADKFPKNALVIISITDTSGSSISATNLNGTIELKSNIRNFPGTYLDSTPVWSVAIATPSGNDVGTFFDQGITNSQFYVKWKPRFINENRTYKITLRLEKDGKKIAESGYLTVNVRAISYYVPGVESAKVDDYLDIYGDFYFKTTLFDSAGRQINNLPRLEGTEPSLAVLTMTANGTNLFKKNIYLKDVVNNGTGDSYYLIKVSRSEFLAQNPEFSGSLSESFQLNIGGKIFLTNGYFNIQ